MQYNIKHIKATAQARYTIYALPQESIVAFTETEAKAIVDDLMSRRYTWDDYDKGPVGTQYNPPLWLIYPKVYEENEFGEVSL